MSNPLTDVLPDKWRKRGYAALWIVGSTLTAATVAFAAIGGEIPTWLLFVSAFFGSITGPLWAVPASNVR